MKVLYVGNLMGFRNAAHYYKIPQKLLNGFVAAGHNVYAFNDRDHARASTVFRSRAFGRKKMERRLLETVECYGPDLIIITTELVSDDTLKSLRSAWKNVPIVYLNVDSLTQAGNVGKLERKADIVDGIFITTGDQTINRFETSQTFVRFLPNPVDKRVDTGRAFEVSDHVYDVFLAAHAIRDNDDPRARLVKDLEKVLHDMRLGFFGSAGNGQALLGVDYMRTLSRSKVGLSLNRNDDYLYYASDRMTHYLGNGLLTALRRGQGFEDWFAEDEVIYFSDTDDLEKGIRSSLADDIAWREKAKSGCAKAHRLFSSERLARYMIESTFSEPYSESYEWPC